MTSLKKALISVLTIVGFYFYSNGQTVEQTASIIDAKEWAEDSAFPIIGTCHFFEDELLSPEDCKTRTGEIKNFPELWTAKPNEETAFGVATYQIDIALPAGHQKELALTIPQIYSSYKLWVDGTLSAENGFVSKSANECVPQWLPETISIRAATDTVTLVLQIANFHHAKGGIKEPIYLGTASHMQFKRTIAEVSNAAESIILFLLGCFFLYVFLSRSRTNVTLYFALLCLSWSVRAVFSNLYLAISFFPDFNWTALLRIEYITLYLTMIWAILFLSRIFLNEANVIIKYGLIFCNLIFILFTLLSPPKVFTQWLNLYLSVSVVLLVYSGFTIIRAWVNERVGSGMLTISIILGLNIFAYDIFVYEGFSSYNPIIFSIGYISIFVLMAWALAMHLNLIKAKTAPTSRLTYDELFKKE